MSFEAGSITGGLEFDFSEFTHGMLAAEGLSHVFGHVVTEFMEEPLLAVADVAKEAARSIYELIEGLSESQHKVSATAEALGVSVEFLDGWGKAAQRVGGNADAVAEAMTHLSRTAVEALKDSTSDTAKAFAKLGVQLTDQNGRLRPVEALMRDLANGLQKMEGGAERTGLAMEILGRGGASSIAFLSQGAAAADAYTEKLRAMGDLTTEQTASQAKDWIGFETELRHTWEGIKAMIGEPLREALTPALRDLVDYVASHRDELKAEFKDLADNLVPAIKSIAQAVEDLIGHLKELKEVGGFLFSPNFGFKKGLSLGIDAGTAIAGGGNVISGAVGGAGESPGAPTVSVGGVTIHQQRGESLEELARRTGEHVEARIKEAAAGEKHRGKVTSKLRGGGL